MFKEIIPNQENTKEVEVKKAFENLDMDLEKDFPELFIRIKELHEQKDSHFTDSLEMAKIIEKL